MKKRIALLTALALALCLWLGTAAPAAAADTSTITAVAEKYLRVLIDTPTGETLREHTVLRGDMAPGLILRAEGEGLAVVGTPTQVGEWTVRVSVRTDSGERELDIEQFIISPDTTPPPSPTPEPEVTATPAPTPEPTLAPTPEGLPAITKNPTGETVTEGGTAMFVARASEAESIEWFLADPAGGEPVEAVQAAASLAGLQVYGQGTETLTLSGIPASMNGWQAECRFTGATGAVAISSRAGITVRQGALAAPAITLQPEGAELYAGESVTLMTRAAAPEGGTLRYQWYSSDRYDLASVRAIEGAEESSFTPPNTEGTTYYCVGIRSTRDGEESSTAYSRLVEVTCHAAVREHFHDYSGPWHWDELRHWHECSCGLRQDEAYHLFTWTVTQRPTARADGARQGVCSVCGFETVEVLPAGSAARSGAAQTVLIVLLVLVILLLLAGAGYVILRSRGRGPRPPRGGTYNGSHVRR